MPKVTVTQAPSDEPVSHASQQEATEQVIGEAQTQVIGRESQPCLLLLTMVVVRESEKFRPSRPQNLAPSSSMCVVPVVEVPQVEEHGGPVPGVDQVFLVPCHRRGGGGGITTQQALRVGPESGVLPVWPRQVLRIDQRDVAVGTAALRGEQGLWIEGVRADVCD